MKRTTKAKPAARIDRQSPNIHRNTPESFLVIVRSFSAIGLDPCSNATSTVGARVAWDGGKRATDGLRRAWRGFGVVFVNPPYGRWIVGWFEKIKREAALGVEVIALVAARPGSAWYRNSGAAVICELSKRLKFPPLKVQAMFSSAVLYYGPRADDFAEHFAQHGTIRRNDQAPPPRKAPASSSSPKPREAAALYHRVSKRDQDPAGNVAEVRAYADAHSFDVRLDERETGSGARNDRPGLARVMKAARGGAVRHVLVWKLDRFGRSQLDMLGNIDQLRAAGVTFHAVSQGMVIRPDADAASMHYYATIAAGAEYERGLISERTASGMQRARRRGAAIGRPRTERPKPAAIARLRKKGYGLRRIAKELGVTLWQVRTT